MTQIARFIPLLLIVAAFGCGDTNGPSLGGPSNGSEAVDVFIVHQQATDNRIYANGTILANEEVELRNEIAGRVVMLNVSEGAKVNRGDVLLQIDASEHEAQLARLNSQLNIAEKDEARKRELLTINGVSQEVYDIAAALVQELKAEIRLTESRLRNSRILAPFNGRVGLRYVSPGAFLGMGDRIAVLVQDDPVKIEFNVPQRYAPMMQIGQQISFKYSGAREPFTAEVYATEPRIDIGTRTLRVRAKCDNAEGALIPGAFVEIELILETLDDALMVPTEVVIPQLQGQKLFVMRGGKAESVEIETGIRTETMVQVTRGLAAGDTVITTALLALKDGAVVKPRNVIRP
jgi:membrane fusion protein (multidrug efflux system)